MSSSFSQSDWETLRELRDRFLSEKTDYWKSPRHLELYDQFFAQRIRWKWDAVLPETKTLTFPLEVFDWGCGTGIASRTYLRSRNATTVWLHDQSSLAMDFAEQQLRAEFPAVTVRRGVPEQAHVLLLSHVLNELTRPELLASLFKKAEAALWVEPGTYEVSQKMVEWREKLRKDFFPVAPCAHDAVCGLLNSSKDWCHHFAPTPSAVFQSSDWKAFSQHVGIDLRSLPLAYLILHREKPGAPSGSFREIGKARFYKGYLKTLLCSEKGVQAARLLKKADRSLFKSWEEPLFARRVPEGTRALQFDKS